MSSLKLLTIVFLIMVITTTPCQGGMPSHSVSCCTQLAKRIPKYMLRQVTRVRFQKKDGICNLRAVVMSVGNREKCMDPNIKALQAWLKRKRPTKPL